MKQDFVILAAGKGTRLRKGGSEVPKPMYEVLGVSLIERLIHQVARSDYRRIIVVLGYEKERVRAFVKNIKALSPIPIEFVVNDEFEKSNGISILKAAQANLSKTFVFSMCDHIFDESIVKNIGHCDLLDAELTLATDRKIGDVYDLDDATKVRCKDQKISKISKTLDDYNAVDVGIFRVTHEFIHALAKVHEEKGDVSLSDGVQHLAMAGRARVFDIGQAWWQDADTVETAKNGEALILQSLIKKSDVWIARNINRKISLPITAFLAKNTQVTPNQITVFTSLLSVSAYFFAAHASYLGFFLAAFVYNLASILDGCDGELARLKFRASKIGAWVDTIGDNLSHLFYFGGLAVGLSAYYGSPLYLNLGVVTLLMVGTLLALMFYEVARQGQGSLLFIEAKISSQRSGTFLSKGIESFTYLMRRANFATLFLVLAAFNLNYLILFGVSFACFVAFVYLSWARLQNAFSNEKSVSSPIK